MRGVFGSRNAPTTAYAAFIPEMGINERGQFFGGLFLDGRASTLEEQAGMPFLNPLEMNNADKQEVILKIMQARYANDFEALFGDGIFNDTELAYEKMSEAIAAFERTRKLTAFSSKFDAVQRGDAEFSAEEQNGFEVFMGKGLCVNCHAIAEPNVFSSFAYFNLGVPANPDNPFLTLNSTINPDGVNFVDLGLGAFLDDPLQNGKFKTPTLRNVARTAPYMHNGVFKNLEDVVDFYNNRDVDGVVPEVAENVADFANIGELGLTDEESRNLVAFMRTLTDGFNRHNDSGKPRR